MDVKKAYSRRSLFSIIFFTALFCILINTGFLFTLKAASEKILILANSGIKSPELKDFIYRADAVTDMLRTYFIPVSAGVMGLFGFLLWFFLRLSFEDVIKDSDILTQKKPKNTAVKDTAVDTKEKELNDRRLFLHLFSVLQREGRLMDFFSEDLQEYEDDQIGAAVRNIHENCKKAVSKYLTFDSVVKEEEEEDIIVSPGFDPTSIKLTGNVTGEPPFNGVVRHRGWRVRKLDMPTLSGSQDPDILAPAEVEIL